MDRIEELLSMVLEAEKNASKALTELERRENRELGDEGRAQYAMRRALEEILVARRALERDLEK